VPLAELEDRRDITSALVRSVVAELGAARIRLSLTAQPIQGQRSSASSWSGDAALPRDASPEQEPRQVEIRVVGGKR